MHAQDWSARAQARPAVQHRASCPEQLFAAHHLLMPATAVTLAVHRHNILSMMISMLLLKVDDPALVTTSKFQHRAYQLEDEGIHKSAQSACSITEQSNHTFIIRSFKGADLAKSTITHVPQHPPSWGFERLGRHSFHPLTPVVPKLRSISLRIRK